MAILGGENGGSIKIHYREQGEGEPLVLIGGITSVLEVWDLMVPELARQYRVITPDNRGSGRTVVPDDDGDRRPARLADDIRTLLDGLGLSKVHLVGASMGGMIVQEFALAHPERLASLTICCSNVGGTRSVMPSREVIAQLFGGASGEASKQASRETLRILVHPDSFAKCPERLDFYIETREKHPHSEEELGRRAAGIRTLDTYDGLTRLAVPTLVMTGSDDRLVPKENSSVLREAIPGAELVEIPQSGHIFFAEQPQASVSALVDFLERHPLAV